MAFGCVRAIINRKSAYIFDAHKPTIKVSRRSRETIEASCALLKKIPRMFKRNKHFAYRSG